MLGSIFVGLSGMNAFSGGLRQISNNITNINTTGFKTTNLLFSDHVSVGERTGDSGQGVSLTKPTIDFAQGELRQSDRDLDLAIDGNGFLVLLKDADKFFIRTGSFEVNAKGDIVLTGTEYKLTVVDDAGKLTPVSVEAFRTNPPKQTTTIKLADNLSSTAAEFSLPAVKVFDTAGAAADRNVKFTRDAQAAPGEWTVTVSEGATTVGTQTLKFIGGIVDPATTRLTKPRPVVRRRLISRAMSLHFHRAQFRRFALPSPMVMAPATLPPLQSTLTEYWRSPIPISRKSSSARSPSPHCAIPKNSNNVMAGCLSLSTKAKNNS